MPSYACVQRLLHVPSRLNTVPQHVAKVARCIPKGANSPMSLQRKLKTALDETRLLILGAQVLFGFQFNGAFQELFEELPLASRYLHCAALLLIMSAIGLLIAPSMRHRVVEGCTAARF
jgi:Family of unknown function (DUF6328)